MIKTSLPGTDAASIDLLKAKLRRKTRLCVVDPDRGVVERYRRLIRADVDHIGFSFEQFDPDSIL